MFFLKFEFEGQKERKERKITEPGTSNTFCSTAFSLINENESSIPSNLIQQNIPVYLFIDLVFKKKKKRKKERKIINEPAEGVFHSARPVKCFSAAC